LSRFWFACSSTTQHRFFVSSWLARYDVRRNDREFLVVEVGQQQKYRFWNILAYCHHEKVLDPFFNIFPFPSSLTRAPMGKEEDLHNPQQPMSREATNAKCHTSVKQQPQRRG